MSKENTSGTSVGIGIGNVVAVVGSWATNHSILWAVIHGILGWFYILYRIAGCGGSGH